MIVFIEKNNFGKITLPKNLTNESGKPCVLKKEHLENLSFQDNSHIAIVSNKENLPIFYESGVICFGNDTELIKNADSSMLIGTGNPEIGKLAKIRSFSLRSISFEGRENICDAIMSIAKEWKKLLIIVDLKVLDSSILPDGQIAGLSARELLYFLQRIRILKNLKGIIITGFGELNNETSRIIEKLLLETA